MPKTSSKWVCQECGHTSLSYLGKCPECNSWSSLIEEFTYKKSSKDISGESKNTFSLSSSINLSGIQRIKTFDKELDNVLGGGFVWGSLILLAGEPGIGKSTILLQIADFLSNKLKVAYVTAEESITQIKITIHQITLI